MDDIDLRIIQELVPNSRVTYRELADKLRVSANSAHKRVQNMVEQRIIQQFTLRLTPAAVPQVWVRVCGVSATTLMDETVKRLGQNQHTSMVAVSSNNSFHVVGVLRDVSELNRYVNFVIRTGEISDPTVRLLNLPRLQSREKISLTDTDYKIIAALQDNCRKQIVDVARELDLSAKTVRRRLERMEAAELICYEVRFDHGLLGGIFTLLDLYLLPGADNRDAVALIRNKYSKNLMELRTFSTLPNDITIDVWTKTTAELKELQDALQKEGYFEKVVPILVYKVYRFDTWLDQQIRDKASGDRKAT